MKVRAGFIPLVDSAVLLVAARRGFAAQEGIALELTREASWATLRDKLTVGVLDAAHMLGPIPVASQLGLGNPKAPMVVPFALSGHGNAVSVSNALWAEMQASGRLGTPHDVAATAAALAAVVRTRVAGGREKLVLGVVHPFSSHNFALRYMLASAGVHPDRDVTLTVVPPSFVVAALSAGEVDGFSVGAPWSEVGAAAGVSRTVIVERDVWWVAPEKVLAMREDRAESEPELVDALIRALKAAAGWAADPGNREALVRLLCAPDAVGVDEAAIAASLAGRSAAGAGAVDDSILFDGSTVLVPQHAHALWFYAQMVRWGMTSLSPAHAALARRAYRPDIWHRALGDASGTVALGGGTAAVATDHESGAVLSHPERGAARNPEGTAAEPAPGRGAVMPGAVFDGTRFDPARLEDYLALFPVHAQQAMAQRG